MPRGTPPDWTMESCTCLVGSARKVQASFQFLHLEFKLGSLIFLFFFRFGFLTFYLYRFCTCLVGSVTEEEEHPAVPLSEFGQCVKEYLMGSPAGQVPLADLWRFLPEKVPTLGVRCWIQSKS